PQGGDGRRRGPTLLEPRNGGVEGPAVQRLQARRRRDGRAALAAEPPAALRSLVRRHPVPVRRDVSLFGPDAGEGDAACAGERRVRRGGGPPARRVRTEGSVGPGG